MIFTDIYRSKMKKVNNIDDHLRNTPFLSQYDSDIYLLVSLCNIYTASILLKRRRTEKERAGNKSLDRKKLKVVWQISRARDVIHVMLNHMTISSRDRVVDKSEKVGVISLHRRFGFVLS